MLYYLLLFLVLCVQSVEVCAAAEDIALSDTEFNKILSLDIDELTVTSVSKKSEKARDAAAAIYVITQEDLRRAGISSIPEALRMVPGVDVAQIDAHSFTVSVHSLSLPARGLNSELANKLLVLIDGRSIYTPVLSRVYWDMEDPIIADIDRIEVIRGPGATLWGVNAVNGVINIVTKSAKNTQGKYLTVRSGSKEYLNTEGRYGGRIGHNVFYRLYAKQLHTGSGALLEGGNAFDNWSQLRSGFRVDSDQEDDNYTVQGDILTGQEGKLENKVQLTPPFMAQVVSDNAVRNSNILTRWKHDISDISHTSTQFYINNYRREERNSNHNFTTIDIDFQHDIATSRHNKMIWGGGYRYITDRIETHPELFIQYPKQNYATSNLFLQNEYAIIPERLFWTVGSKFEHNDFTGYEVEPSTRASYKLNATQTLWGAVSRAVRVPSRAEEDLDLIAVVRAGAPGAPVNSSHLIGRDVQSEKLLAYELGYRLYPNRVWSVDMNSFYNDYDNLVSVSRGIPFRASDSTVIPVRLANFGDGYSYGAEASGNWAITERWKIAGSYSYITLHARTRGNGIMDIGSAARASPHHVFSLRSYMSPMQDVEWDNMFYYNDDLPVIEGGIIRSIYNLRVDSRMGWKPMAGMELSLTGRNLFNRNHAEYIDNPSIVVGTTLIGAVSWNF